MRDEGPTAPLGAPDDTSGAGRSRAPRSPPRRRARGEPELPTTFPPPVVDTIPSCRSGRRPSPVRVNPVASRWAGRPERVADRPDPPGHADYAELDQPQRSASVRSASPTNTIPPNSSAQAIPTATIALPNSRHSHRAAPSRTAVDPPGAARRRTGSRTARPPIGPAPDRTPPRSRGTRRRARARCGRSRRRAGPTLLATSSTRSVSGVRASSTPRAAAGAAGRGRPARRAAGPRSRSRRPRSVRTAPFHTALQYPS